MRNHWSCSRFADFLRGESKPKALGLDEWKEWRERVRSEHPVGYYLAERLLPALQKFVFFPADTLDSLRSYCRNRFVTKTHFLKTGLKPGSYHEIDERIIHGLFNELKEFVEVELAHLQSYHKEKRYNFRNGRCPQAGIDHLKWAASLRYGESEFVEKDDPDYGKPTPQAESAVKIMELYGWWTETRPNRPDPMEASGLNDCYEKNIKDKKAAFKKLNKIEREYDREDDKMLVRLVKLRRHLWT
jgi:hypothetical protein